MSPPFLTLFFGTQQVGKGLPYFWQNWCFPQCVIKVTQEEGYIVSGMQGKHHDLEEKVRI